MYIERIYMMKGHEEVGLVWAKGNTPLYVKEHTLIYEGLKKKNKGTRLDIKRLSWETI